MSTLKRLFATSATTLSTGFEITPPVGKVWNVPRLYICNISDAPATVAVSHKSSSTEVFLIKDHPLDARDTLILENIALVSGDTIVVSSDAPYSINCYGAIIEEDA